MNRFPTPANMLFPLRSQMEKEILLINKLYIQSLRSRIARTDQLKYCVEEIQKMVDIMFGICWRADFRAGCCGSDISVYLYMQIRLLEKTLETLKSGDIDKTEYWLELYEKMYDQTAIAMEA